MPTPWPQPRPSTTRSSAAALAREQGDRVPAVRIASRIAVPNSGGSAGCGVILARSPLRSPPPAVSPAAAPRAGAAARACRGSASSCRCWRSPASSGGRPSRSAAAPVHRARARGAGRGDRALRARHGRARRALAAAARGRGRPRPTREDTYALTCIGYMGNNILPARAGDAIRVVLMAPRAEHVRSAPWSARWWPSGCSTSPCSSCSSSSSATACSARSAAARSS